jgi:hypothetical protein
VLEKTTKEVELMGQMSVYIPAGRKVDLEVEKEEKRWWVVAQSDGGVYEVRALLYYQPMAVREETLRRAVTQHRRNSVQSSDDGSCDTDRSGIARWEKMGDTALGCIDTNITGEEVGIVPTSLPIFGFDLTTSKSMLVTKLSDFYHTYQAVVSTSLAYLVSTSSSNA